MTTKLPERLVNNNLVVGNRTWLCLLELVKGFNNRIIEKTKKNLVKDFMVTSTRIIVCFTGLIVIGIKYMFVFTSY